MRTLTKFAFVGAALVITFSLPITTLEAFAVGLLLGLACGLCVFEQILQRDDQVREVDR